MRSPAFLLRQGLVALAPAFVVFALTAPTDVQLPGTQPQEVVGLQPPTDCGNCHGTYDPDVSPYDTWVGSPMAHASRDPLFWAALAVAEQDFDGAGDLCLRCHLPSGWMDGRSEPTDGSAMDPLTDGEGVECMLCHRLTNPDDSEWQGVQNPPFIANDGGNPAEGWYGSGMYVLADGDTRYGPYANVNAPHPTRQSRFHRDPALCGTCHDVSNPVTGDLAPNNGAQVPLPPGSFSDQLGSPVTQKAGFLNPPYAYGVVERTFSEHMASSWPTTRVSDYGNLPAELQDGAPAAAWSAAQIAGNGGDYEDGTPRYFTCQTCHMHPVEAKGAAQVMAPVRKDMPLHDLTGGNVWLLDVVQWLETRNRLRVGNTLDQFEHQAMDRAKSRARATLRSAARLELDRANGILRVYNLTGHKLLTGYPEGRRMWLNVRWYDDQGQLLREDGAYGPLSVQVGPYQLTVESILDLADPNLHLWEAKMGIGQEWANELLGMGLSPNLVLEYDRITGLPTRTLGQLAAEPPGTAWPTFHFVLNDTVVSDDRIPPYGFSYDEARRRNALPVPETLYGDPGPGGTYQHWAEVPLNPPTGAKRAEFSLLYQATSWEYVQFLYLANDGSNAFLASAGEDLARAWYATGMAHPELMARLVVTIP